MRLAMITQKIDLLEKSQKDIKQIMDRLGLQSVDLDKKISRLEKAFETLEDDFKKAEKLPH